MRFITGKHIPRRTFLRGVGATVALPFLDAMVPAGGRAPLAAEALTGASEWSSGTRPAEEAARLICIEEVLSLIHI